LGVKPSATSFFVSLSPPIKEQPDNSKINVRENIERLFILSIG